MKPAPALLLVLAIGACNGSSGGGPAGSPDAADPGIDAAPGDDLNMQPSDFECILHWDKVNQYRITNKLGHLDEALAVANSSTGGTFPVGTIIQLVPFEASVKRRVGFDPANDDWEFFSLQVSSSGTTIVQRGTTAVTNQFGGNCHDCHAKAMPQWDFVCGTTHGCDPLPINGSQIDQLQMNDARCP